MQVYDNNSVNYKYRIFVPESSLKILKKITNLKIQNHQHISIFVTTKQNDMVSSPKIKHFQSMYHYYYFFPCLYCSNSKYTLSCSFFFLKVFLIGGPFLNYTRRNFILKVIKKDIYRSLKSFPSFRNSFWHGMFFLCLTSFPTKRQKHSKSQDVYYFKVKYLIYNIRYVCYWFIIIKLHLEYLDISNALIGKRKTKL